MKKTQRIIGTETIVDAQTGEVKKIEYREVDEYEKDSNFHKIFLNQFCSALNVVTNQKTKLVFWILQHLTKKNEILYTYRQIADKTGISYATVAETMKSLQDTDFIRKNSTGYYMVNPDIIYKGSLQRRCMTLDAYHKLPKPNDTLSTDKIRLDTLSKNISRLQKEQKKLLAKVDNLESEISKNDQIE